MHAEAVAVLVRSVGWQWIGKTDGVEFIRRLLGRIGLLAGTLGGNFARRKKHVDDLKTPTNVFVPGDNLPRYSIR